MIPRLVARVSVTPNPTVAVADASIGGRKAASLLLATLTAPKRAAEQQRREETP